MRWNSGSYVLELLNEPDYSFGSTDNVRTYGSEWVLTGSALVTSTHGLTCYSQNDDVLGSLVIGAGGGASGVHDRSLATANGQCFMAVGDSVAAVEIPSMRRRWSTCADSATCFGVYLIDTASSLLVHGEMEITKLSLAGEVVWSFSGRDIFTGSFIVGADHVVAEDWDGNRYRLSLQSGVQL